MRFFPDMLIISRDTTEVWVEDKSYSLLLIVEVTMLYPLDQTGQIALSELL